MKHEYDAVPLQSTETHLHGDNSCYSWRRQLMRLTEEEALQIAEEVLASLAAEGLLYDTGERENGQIVWAPTPMGREFQKMSAEGR